MTATGAPSHGTDTHDLPLYPLRFTPMCQYRPWGGRRLASLLPVPLPGDGPIGEAWLLSDRDDHRSVVAEGPLKGRTITQLIEQSPTQMMGALAGRFDRFPLLLKFLDARDTLSVQVHPSDRQTRYLPPGEHGKTEAWVVLQAARECRIYAGLDPRTTLDVLKQAVANGTVAQHLASFTPKPGDAVLLPAGTVHTLGGLVVFEVQQNSDVTFRLYDWDHVDPRSGRKRPLHVAQAMACIDFTRGVVGPSVPTVEATTPVRRERLLECEHFTVWRFSGAAPFTAGAAATPRVLVCIDGSAVLRHNRTSHAMATGDVVLLPASVGACRCRPDGTVTLLEIALPDVAAPV